MNHRSELLLLHQADFLARRQPIHDALMQVCRSHLDRMARQISSIEAIKPARAQIAPGTFSRDGVIANTVFARLCEGPVGDLKHAHGA